MRAQASYRAALLLALCVAVSALAACSLRAKEPDSDSSKLITMSSSAREIARKEIPDPILRQIGTNGYLQPTMFFFTDAAGTKEIDITALKRDDPAGQWAHVAVTLSPLLGQPGSDIKIQDMLIGPGRAAGAASDHWPGCIARGMTLYRQDSKLVWLVDCDTDAGMVSGLVDAMTGALEPVGGSPAALPVTATPQP